MMFKGDLPPDDITFWREEHVCNWLTHIHLDITDSAMQLLYNSVKRHQINGQRLLNLTKNDLKFLGQFGVQFGFRSCANTVFIPIEAHMLLFFDHLIIFYFH